MPNALISAATRGTITIGMEGCRAIAAAWMPPAPPPATNVKSHVTSLLGANLGDQIRHHGIDGRKHRLRRLVDVHVQLPAHPRHRFVRAGHVELDVTTEKIVGGYVAKQG